MNVSASCCQKCELVDRQEINYMFWDVEGISERE